MGSYMNRYCRTWIGLTWEGPDMNRSFEICQIYNGHEWGQTWKGPDMNRSFWTWMRSDMNRAWHESLGHESVDMNRVDMNRTGLNGDNPYSNTKIVLVHPSRFQTLNSNLCPYTLYSIIKLNHWLSKLDVFWWHIQIGGVIVKDKIKATIFSELQPMKICLLMT